MFSTRCRYCDAEMYPSELREHHCMAKRWKDERDEARALLRRWRDRYPVIDDYDEIGADTDAALAPEKARSQE